MQGVDAFSQPRPGTIEDLARQSADPNGQMTAFWSRVKEVRDWVVVTVPKCKLQPQTGRTIYITSRRNWSKGTLGGHTVEATLKLGSQRIAEDTHELSSDDQIRTFLEAQSQEAAANQRVAQDKVLKTTEGIAAVAAVGAIRDAIVGKQDAKD